MGKKRTSAEFRKRSDAARRGWETRRRGFPLDVPNWGRDPFRKYLEKPEARKVRRMFALVHYRRPTTGYKDQKISQDLILKVGLGPMTGKAASKFTAKDIEREIKDMGLKGKIIKILGIAALEPASARKGKRVFPKNSKKRRGRRASK